MPKSAPLSVFTTFQESASLRHESAKTGHHTFKGVTIIKAGLGNRRDKHFYPPEVLKEAVDAGLFHGLRAYLDHPTSVDQQIQPERTLRDLVGIYDNPRFVEGNGSPRVVADLYVLPSHRWLAESIQSLRALGYGEKIGISINGRGQTVPDRMKLEEGGEPTEVFRVKKFTALPSADLVTEAGAGGGFQQLLESARGAASPIKEQAMTIQEQLQALVSEDKVSKETIEELLRQHAAVEESDPGEGDPEDDEDDEDDPEGAEDGEDDGDVEESDPGDEDDTVECGGCSKGVREGGMPHGVPKSGSGSATKKGRSKEPARGRKFGESDVHRILSDNERLRRQNERLREALTITQKRDRIAKLLKESKLPVQVRGPLAKRLMRLASEAEVRDEIRFQQSLLESAVDSVAADLDFDEVEGAGARFRESAGSGTEGDLLGVIGQSLPLKAK